MNLVSFIGSFAHFFASMQIDDSSVALIALLAGMAGGWRLPGWHEQLKAKRAKIERKAQVLPRKPD
jgi:hypothetical protein